MPEEMLLSSNKQWASYWTPYKTSRDKNEAFQDACPQVIITEMGESIGTGNTSRPREAFIPNPKLKLLDQVSEVMRYKHYSLRTERTYREWIRRDILFHGKRHPGEMGRTEVERFLSDLAVRGKVAAATQNQAFRLVEG